MGGTRIHTGACFGLAEGMGPAAPAREPTLHATRLKGSGDSGGRTAGHARCNGNKMDTMSRRATTLEGSTQPTMLVGVKACKSREGHVGAERDGQAITCLMGPYPTRKGLP